MKRIIIILFFISNTLFAQVKDKFLNDFLLESKLKQENVLYSYNQLDYSNIWLLTENNNVLGIIGKEHQRIKIKFTSVKRNKGNSIEYLVSGKSNVKGVICDFNGKITLTKVKEVKALHFGVDNEYATKGIKSQGILIANYEFKEDSEQKYSGVFKGKLYSKWYLDSKNQIQYDNIESMSDGYMNNAFIGRWISYTTGKEKVCNWGDYRVPYAERGFDIGAGEFSPSEKYYDRGWDDYDPMEKDEWWK